MYLENKICYGFPWLKYKYATQVFHTGFSMQAYVFKVYLLLLSGGIGDKNSNNRLQKDWGRE